jgi:nucleoside-diphosphate-sugar epimerase
MILVTGGGGFIGSQVCRALVAQGHEVVAVDQHINETVPWHIAQGDISTPDFLSGLFHTHAFSAIIHLASMRNSNSQRDPEAALRVNIGSSLSLLQLAQQYNVPTFVYSSSISAYGLKSYADYGEVSESEPAAPNNVYGLCKRYVEVVGEQYRRAGKLQFVALRMAMVVGPGVTSDASQWRGEIFEKLHATRPVSIKLPYGGNDILPLIHVADVADMLCRLAQASRTEYALYNTPAETWRCADLAAYIHSLNPNVELSLTPAMVRGDPEAIDGRRFEVEFDYTLPTLRDRLRRAAEK